MSVRGNHPGLPGPHGPGLGDWATYLHGYPLLPCFGSNPAELTRKPTGFLSVSSSGVIFTGIQVGLPPSPTRCTECYCACREPVTLPHRRLGAEITPCIAHWQPRKQLLSPRKSGASRLLQVRISDSGTGLGRLHSSPFPALVHPYRKPAD